MSNWESLTLGDILPGPAASIGGISASANDLFGQFNAISNQLSAKVSAVMDIVAVTGNLATSLAEAGFYSIALEPAAGGWESRLSSAAGAPPSSGACAGLCIIIQGPDPLAIADKYAKLQAILTSPVSIP